MEKNFCRETLLGSDMIQICEQSIFLMTKHVSEWHMMKTTLRKEHIILFLISILRVKAFHFALLMNCLGQLHSKISKFKSNNISQRRKFLTLPSCRFCHSFLIGFVCRFCHSFLSWWETLKLCQLIEPSLLNNNSSKKKWRANVIARLVKNTSFEHHNFFF